jgi:hypothetical protein
VTSSSGVWLGIIALSTLAIALVQVGLIVAAAILARRVGRLSATVEREIRPLFVQLEAISRDASRISGLAAAQVERADRVMADVATRVEETVAALQSGIVGPMREGRAVVSGLRAAFEALRAMRADARRGRGEEEDALFI